MPNDRPEQMQGTWTDEDEREFQEMVRADCQRAASVRTKKKREAFVRVPIWWAEQCARWQDRPSKSLLPCGCSIGPGKPAPTPFRSRMRSYVSSESIGGRSAVRFPPTNGLVYLKLNGHLERP
jgi:hypothetical protein